MKFRLDRIYRPKQTKQKYHEKPTDYNISEYCRKVFSMYDGELRSVKLCCDNAIMKEMIDKFGEGVKTEIIDGKYFSAEAEISISPTFFAWVSTYAGKIRIISPQSVADEYKVHIQKSL